MHNRSQRINEKPLTLSQNAFCLSEGYIGWALKSSGVGTHRKEWYHWVCVYGNSQRDWLCLAWRRTDCTQNSLLHLRMEKAPYCSLRWINPLIPYSEEKKKCQLSFLSPGYNVGETIWFDETSLLIWKEFLPNHHIPVLVQLINLKVNPSYWSKKWEGMRRREGWMKCHGFTASLPAEICSFQLCWGNT